MGTLPPDDPPARYSRKDHVTKSVQNQTLINAYELRHKIGDGYSRPAIGAYPQLLVQDHVEEGTVDF